jgi:uncharacterized repeat protein (TIGR03803 family)
VDGRLPQPEDVKIMKIVGRIGMARNLIMSNLVMNKVKRPTLTILALMTLLGMIAIATSARAQVSTTPLPTPNNEKGHDIFLHRPGLDAFPIIRMPGDGAAKAGAVGSGAVASSGSAEPSTTFYKIKILHEFGGDPRDGFNPFGDLARDAAGNLYGTTGVGGLASPSCWQFGPNYHQCGTVYKLDPAGNETVLHNFTGGTDGGYPLGGVVLDSQGNLYGTTSLGGHNITNCGTVYKIDPQGNFSILYSFDDCNGLTGPGAGLIADSAGNMYGTTQAGGAHQNGSIFKIDASGNYSLLHSFAGWDGGGGLDSSPLTLDAAGNLYGSMVFQGGDCCGTVFRLGTDGKLTVLYSFTGGYDGEGPNGHVAVDAQGNVYGATLRGGTIVSMFGIGEPNPGVAFKISHDRRFRVLHKFTGTGGSNGGGLVPDGSGNFYGTTTQDGVSATGSAGSVYKISPGGKETDLFLFSYGANGCLPYGNVIPDSAGNLYGTTITCGVFGGGTVYELSPQ